MQPNWLFLGSKKQFGRTFRQAYYIQLSLRIEEILILNNYALTDHQQIRTYSIVESRPSCCKVWMEIPSNLCKQHPYLGMIFDPKRDAKYEEASLWHSHSWVKGLLCSWKDWSVDRTLAQDDMRSTQLILGVDCATKSGGSPLCESCIRILVMQGSNMTWPWSKLTRHYSNQTHIFCSKLLWMKLIHVFVWLMVKPERFYGNNLSPILTFWRTDGRFIKRIEWLDALAYGCHSLSSPPPHRI